MIASLFDLAQRFVGIAERPGTMDHPFIVWCLELDHEGVEVHDEIAWCSAALNRLAWLLRLPRSKSWRARSWLDVGLPIALAEARPVADVVILSDAARGPQAGHVGLFASRTKQAVSLLAGNQRNTFSLQPYPRSRVIGVRRLA